MAARRRVATAGFARCRTVWPAASCGQRCRWRRAPPRNGLKRGSSGMSRAAGQEPTAASGAWPDHRRLSSARSGAAGEPGSGEPMSAMRTPASRAPRPPSRAAPARRWDALARRCASSRFAPLMAARFCTWTLSTSAPGPYVQEAPVRPAVPLFLPSQVAAGHLGFPGSGHRRKGPTSFCAAASVASAFAAHPRWPRTRANRAAPTPAGSGSTCQRERLAGESSKSR